MLLKRFILLSLGWAATCAIASSNHSCGDWEPYRDEKCFKVFSNLPLQKFSDAQATCDAQEGPAKLLSIGSPEEQAFLEKFLFTSSKVVDTVWLGASNTGGKFHWSDGASLSFSNWASGSPKGHADYCVQMNPDDGSKGKWTDEPCGKKNLVACEKVPTLSLAEMKEILFNVRKEQQTTTATLRAQVTLSKQLLSSVTQLQTELKQSSVPLGFTYVQLPKEKAPNEIWPLMTWTEVSSAYSGVFFRVAGSGAAEFDSIQEASSPRLTQVEFKDCQNYPTSTCGSIRSDNPLSLPGDGTWSDWVVTADGYVHSIAGIDRSNLTKYIDYLRFRHSTDEVRPRNMAVKVWKRTA